MAKKITKTQWKKFVSKNCGDTYSFAVCFTILEIWESGAKTKEEARDVVKDLDLDLSGFQAESAIKFALNNDAEKWLDKDMVKISRKNITL